MLRAIHSAQFGLAGVAIVQYGITIGSGNSLIHTNIVTANNQSAMSFTNIEACASCTLIDNHAP